MKFNYQNIFFIKNPDGLGSMQWLKHGWMLFKKKDCFLKLFLNTNFEKDSTQIFGENKI